MTWLLVDDVARMMHVHPRTIQRWCRERRIPHVKVGRGVRFTADQLREIEAAFAVDPDVHLDVNAPNPDFHHRAVVVPMVRQDRDGGR